MRESPHPEHRGATVEHPPAEQMVAAQNDSEAFRQPAVAAGVLVSETLSFGDTIERLVEFTMIVAIGVALSTHWDARAIPLAAVIFLVIRPLASTLLVVTPTSRSQRWMMAWFGIRGIGSLYYLGYSLEHGLAGPLADEIVALTISVISLSIFVHGISSTPLLRQYERALK